MLLIHPNITGVAHRRLSEAKYAYVRPETSCNKADRKYCTVTSFENCDAAAIAAKLPDTYAKTANKNDRPPGCYFDTNSNTLNYNVQTKQSYPAGSRFGLLCELCPKTDCPGEGTCDKNLKGDKYCDDEINNCACDWDGGDCCNEDADRTYCKKCVCLDPDFEKIKYIKQKGGFCKDKQNCKITTRVECDIAAAELGEEDTKHSKQVPYHAWR